MAAVYTDSGTCKPQPGDAVSIKDKARTEKTSRSKVLTRAQLNTVVMHEAPLVLIKEEPLDDDEFFQIKIHDTGGSSDESTESGVTFPTENDSGDGQLFFHCADCSETFQEREAYLEHTREHVHDGPVVCLDSDSQWDDLLVSEDSGRSTLCCALCGQKFSNSEGFLSHQLKHSHKKIKEEPMGEEVVPPVPNQRNFECKDCGKAFSTRGLCLNHQRSHKQALKSVFHQLAHLKTKSFQCPTCGRCYSRASALDAHRHCHEIKLVKAQSSDTKKSHLPLTKNVPVGTCVANSEKVKLEYECVQCGKLFRSLSGLNTHHRFSSNPACAAERPKEHLKKAFHCSECDKKFQSIAALTCHQHWHVRWAKNSSSGQSLACKECGKVFSTPTFYHKHQRLVHSTETATKSFFNQVCQIQKNAFECQECGRRFSRASALQSHQLCHDYILDTNLDKKSLKQSTAVSLTPLPKLYLCDKDNPKSYAVGALGYSQKTPQQSELASILHQSDLHQNKELTGPTGMKGPQLSSEENELPLVTSPEKLLMCKSNNELIENSNCVILSKDSSSLINSGPVANTRLHVEQEKTENEEKSVFECPECERTFASASAVRCHRLWHKRPMGRAANHKAWTRRSWKEKIFKCKECGKDSCSLDSHQRHLKRHKMQKPCEIPPDEIHNPVDLYNYCKACNSSETHANTASVTIKGFNLGEPQEAKVFDYGKGLCSISSFSHHSQYQQCAEVKEKKPKLMGTSSPPQVGIKHAACSGCGNKLHHRSYLCHVRKQKSIPKKNYKCRICSKTYYMLACFLKHQQSHNFHLLKPPVKSFQHQVGKNTYSCPDCGKLFSHAMVLQLHMRNHGYETGYPVNTMPNIHLKSGDVDNVILTNKDQHNIDMFSPFSDRGVSEQCVTTEEDETNLKSLNCNHFKVKTSKYKCCDCGRVFSTMSARNFHRKIHLDSQNYAVDSEKVSKDQCGRGFSRNFTIGTWGKRHMYIRFGKGQEHSQKCTDQGPYCCNLCGKRFFYFCVFSQHQKYNGCESSDDFSGILRIQPSKSELFGLEFERASQASILDTHFQNSNTKTFTCSHCSVRFSSEEELQKHQSQLHFTVNVRQHEKFVFIEPRSKKSKKHFECCDCGKCFFNVQGLHAHKWQVHHKKPKSMRTFKHGLKAFPCPQCDKHYSSPGALCYHSKTCTGTKADVSLHSFQQQFSKFLYKCPKCGKSFPSVERLEAHKDIAKSRPYCCALCCRGYWTEAQLQQHLIWHDEVRRRLPADLRFRLGTFAANIGRCVNSQSAFHLLRDDSDVTLSLLHLSKVNECCSDTFPKQPNHHVDKEFYHCNASDQSLGECKSRQKNIFLNQGRDMNSLQCFECGINFSDEVMLHNHYIDHARGET